MKINTFQAASAAVLFFQAAGAAFGQQYVATIINPANTTEAFAYGAGGAHQVGMANGPATGGNTHAFLWAGTAVSATDLNPAGCDGSVGYASGGDQQVGVGFSGERTLAVLWSGSAASAVILNPEGMNYATANGTDGVTQVGLGRGPLTFGSTHALVWTGSAESIVDIHPEGYAESYAHSVDGAWIAGVAADFSDAYSAGYWMSPSPESWVSLHPEFGYDETTAEVVNGTSIGGRGAGEATNGTTHALLWLNGGESMVDLHPADYRSSFIIAMRGNTQAGCVQTLPGGEEQHAVVWAGTADSAIDIHGLIPGGPWTISQVSAIDSDGSLYGYATNGEGGVAVKWTLVGLTACGPADIGVAGGLPGFDGVLDNNDFIAFITYFFAQDPVADKGVAGGLPGHDGLFDNNDFIAFITEFFAGC